MRASASPLYDAAGKINGVVASARDVTDIKAAEKQNLQKEKLAAMGEMMSGVAHELNNPLTAILGVSDLLRERAPDDATRRQSEIVLKQARRAAGDRAELAGVCAALGPGAARNCGRSKRCKQVVDQQRASLSQKNISIELVPPAGRFAAGSRSQAIASGVRESDRQRGASDHQPARPRRVARFHRARRRQNHIRLCGRRPGHLSGKYRQKSSILFLPPSVPAAALVWAWRFARRSSRNTAGTIEVQSTQGNGAEFRVLLPEYVETCERA